MGDILHALPAVTALRQAHPGWVIDWVVEPVWRALLSAEPSGERPVRSPAQPVVDNLHLAPTKAWRRNPLSHRTIGEISDLRKKLKAQTYDAVLDLQGAVRSAVVGRLTGCRRRIGEAEPRERAARWLFTEHVTTHGPHVIEQDLELAEAVAGDVLGFKKPWLPVDAAAEAWCDELLGEEIEDPVVLLNPGAGWGAKRWPADRYAAVAAALADGGFRILVNSGPGEESLAHTIRNQSRGAATPLKCSLAQLIALTRRVALVIAGDTGPP